MSFINVHCTMMNQHELNCQYQGKIVTTPLKQNEIKICCDRG